MTEYSTGAPACDEIEVSIFGRGYGEAILIHVGDGRWLAIDSLQESKVSIGRLYLESLGVNLATHLDVLVATHWHDDHVRGLADLFLAAESAEIIVPMAMLKNEFIKFAASFAGQRTGKFSTGVEEFGKILQLAAARNVKGTRYPLRTAHHGYVGYRRPPGVLSHGQLVSLEALSPSHFDVAAFITRISGQMPDPKVLQRAPHYSANDVSAAFWLQIGGHAVLLGADVECSTHLDSGWNAILGASVQPIGKAGLVKVPHHGGASGHHKDMWDQLLTSKPIASLTSWAKGGNRLPSQMDVSRIKKLADAAYSTSPSPYEKSPEQPTRVAKILKKDDVKLHRLGERIGQIRHRGSLRAEECVWTTETFGQAGLL